MFRLLSALLLLVMVSCAPTPPTPETPAKKTGGGAAPQDAAKAAAKKPAAKAGQAKDADKAAKKPAKPYGPELIVNGGFEVWKEAAPDGWAVAYQEGSEWKPLALEPNAEAPGGNAALALKAPLAEAAVVARQFLRLNELNLGHTYTFSAKLKCPAAKGMQVQLHYKVRDRNLVQRLVPQGTGDWETLSTTFPVSKHAVLNSFRVLITLPKSFDQPVGVDDVSLLMGEKNTPA